MSLTKFPNGISSMGVPLLGGAQLPQTTGTYFFVDDSGSNNNTGLDSDHPVATIDYAIGLCTAGKGDVIVVMPGHAETVTTAITCDVTDVTIVGLGYGRTKPAVTTSGAIDGINITAARVTISNIRVIGATSCTALINIAATDANILGCTLEHGAAPLMAITVASGGARFNVSDCYFHGTADGPDCAIDMEATGLDNFVIKGNTFNYAPNGCDLGVVRSNVDSNVGGAISHNLFIAADTVAVDFNSSDSAQGDGIIAYNAIAGGAAIADIDTSIDAGGYCLIENYCTDLPAEGGGLVPVTTPA